MSELTKRLETPIPARMQHLPKDKRGYPIPHNVMIDDDGRPHFTINPEEKRQLTIAQDRCPICNQHLLRGRWFVGGPKSAFHPGGTYIDTAMHYECMEYALKVCPWLAVPSYSKRIDDKTLAPDMRGQLITNDPTQDPTRPPVWVAVMATRMDFIIHPVFGYTLYVKPRPPYKVVEFWKDGKKLGSEEGYALALQSVPVEAIQRKIDKHTQLRSAE